MLNVNNICVDIHIYKSERYSRVIPNERGERETSVDFSEICKLFHRNSNNCGHIVCKIKKASHILFIYTFHSFQSVCSCNRCWTIFRLLPFSSYSLSTSFNIDIKCDIFFHISVGLLLSVSYMNEKLLSLTRSIDVSHRHSKIIHNSSDAQKTLFKSFCRSHTP